MRSVKDAALTPPSALGASQTLPAAGPTLGVLVSTAGGARLSEVGRSPEKAGAERAALRHAPPRGSQSRELASHDSQSGARQPRPLEPRLGTRQPSLSCQREHSRTRRSDSSPGAPPPTPPRKLRLSLALGGNDWALGEEESKETSPNFHFTDCPHLPHRDLKAPPVSPVQSLIQIRCIGGGSRRLQVKHRNGEDTLQTRLTRPNSVGATALCRGPRAAARAARELTKEWQSHGQLKGGSKVALGQCLRLHSLVPSPCICHFNQEPLPPPGRLLMK